jgi:hypothetical protein
MEPSRLLLVAALLAPAITTARDVADELENYVGYTIVGAKTIAGYVNSDGKRKDDFEGCEYGRTIIFDDGTGLKCSSYGYQYAYRPKAIILAKSLSINGTNFETVVMIVESDKYDMQGALLR